MRHLFRAEQLVAEGAGAVGVSALLNGLISDVGVNCAVVISGSNVDMDDFLRIVAE